MFTQLHPQMSTPCGFSVWDCKQRCSEQEGANISAAECLFSLDIVPGVELLDHMEVWGLPLLFWEVKGHGLCSLFSNGSGTKKSN